MNFKIGLDFDGVILDTQSLKPTFCKRMYGLDIPLKYFSSHKIEQQGLTQGQYRELKVQIYEHTSVATPVNESILYINILLGHGYPIRIITSRTGHLLDLAKTSLIKNGLNLEIVGVGEGISKLEHCRGLDLFVDDDLNKLTPLIGVVPHLLLFDWPFNEDYVVSPRITRVKSWWEIYNYVRYEMRP